MKTDKRINNNLQNTTGTQKTPEGIEVHVSVGYMI
jgi:hypothetical protein